MIILETGTVGMMGGGMANGMAVEVVVIAMAMAMAMVVAVDTASMTTIRELSTLVGFSLSKRNNRLGRGASPRLTVLFYFSVGHFATHCSGEHDGVEVRFASQAFSVLGGRLCRALWGAVGFRVFGRVLVGYYQDL